MRLLKISLCIFLSSISSIACSAALETFDYFPVRRGAQLPISSITSPEATATLILLPGGNAGSGEVVDEKPSSQNFLVRTRNQFVGQGFNVITAFRPTDQKTMDYDYRTSQEHIDDIEELINHAKKLAKPVWLVGTSRGTVSALAVASKLGDSAVQGVVLTASVTNRKTGAVTRDRLSRLTMPVLVVHHKNDGCKICDPREAYNAVANATGSSLKKYIEITGGHSPIGDPCEAKHYHGFINYESETIQIISTWIKKLSS